VREVDAPLETDGIVEPVKNRRDSCWGRGHWMEQGDKAMAMDARTGERRATSWEYMTNTR